MASRLVSWATVFGGAARHSVSWWKRSTEAAATNRQPARDPRTASWPLFALTCALLPFLLLAHAGAAPAFHAARLADLETAITNAVAEKKLPGAVLRIERMGLSYQKAYGLRAVEPTRESMSEDTIFDAASLTKVMATTPAVMLLMQRGRVHLDDPVVQH